MGVNGGGSLSKENEEASGMGTCGGRGEGGRRREHRRISDCKEGCEIGLRMECFARGPTAKTTKFFFPARTSARASRNKSHLAPIPESFLGSEKKIREHTYFFFPNRLGKVQVQLNHDV